MTEVITCRCLASEKMLNRRVRSYMIYIHQIVRGRSIDFFRSGDLE